MTRPTRAELAERETAGNKAAFLAEFAERGIVTHACQAAGVSHSVVYDWYGKDDEFASAWDEAKEQATDELEAEAWRRAVKGVERPVFQGGEAVGHVTEYSDRLLELMLKANRPTKYRENTSLEITAVTRPSLEGLTTDELRAEAARILATPPPELPAGEDA